MNHQAERDRRAKAYSYRAYRRLVQQAQAVAQRVQLAVVAGAALVLATGATRCSSRRNRSTRSTGTSPATSK